MILLPNNTKLPFDAFHSFQNKWENWGTYLGTGRKRNRSWRTFKQARSYAISLRLKNRKEWHTYCKSGKLPIDIPFAPWTLYKEDWKDWGYFLGTGAIGYQKRVYRPFKQARKFARSLKLRGYKEWVVYTKTGNLPNDIPNYPDGGAYKQEFCGYRDWLGNPKLTETERLHNKLLSDRNYYQQRKDDPEFMKARRAKARRAYNKKWRKSHRS